MRFLLTMGLLLLTPTAASAAVNSYIWINNASANCGTVSLSGDWGIQDPELRHGGARIDIFIGGAVQSSTVVSGDGGIWYASFKASSCLPSSGNSVQVMLTPLGVPDGISSSANGTFWNNTACTAPTASLSCSRPYPYTYVTCTGSGSGGNGPLTPVWREVLTVWDTGETMASDWWSGSWSDNYGCASSSTRDSNQIRIEFKVQDCSGAESTVRSSGPYYCR